MIREGNRLLFLSPAFPPARAIGAVRCWNLARHLARRGWQVKVVAPHPSLLSDPEPNTDIALQCQQEGITCYWTNYYWRPLTGGHIVPKRWQQIPQIPRICRRFAELAGIDPLVGWNKAALRAVSSIKPGEVDVILVSAPPFTSFFVAREVGRRLQTPYVLDYRDLWNFNPYVNGGARPRQLAKEADILRTAGGVFVVSNAMAEVLRQRFERPLNIAVLANGFAPEDFLNVRRKQFREFAVVYAGTFYPPKITIRPILAAVKAANSLPGLKRDIRLHYFGSGAAHVQQVAEQLGAESQVVAHGMVPRAEVLSALAGAGAAAVVVSAQPQASPEDRTVLTGKVFEAMGAGTTILMICPPGTDAAQMIQSTAAGRCFSSDQVSETAAWLRSLAEGTAVLQERNVESYSWARLAEQADAFLCSILDRSQRRSTCTAEAVLRCQLARPAPNSVSKELDLQSAKKGTVAFHSNHTPVHQ